MGAYKKHLQFGFMTYDITNSEFKYDTREGKDAINAVAIKGIKIKKGSFFSLGTITIETFGKTYEIKFPSKFNNDFLQWKQDFDTGVYKAVEKATMTSVKKQNFSSNHEGNDVISAWYKVTGKNPATGRKKTEKLVWINKATEDEVAKQSGLLPPYTVERQEDTPPSEAQIGHARSLGIMLPGDATMEDASVFLTRAENNEPIHQVGADADFVKTLICKLGIYVPKYANAQEAYWRYIGSLKQEEQVAYFAMRIYSENKGLGYLFPYQATEDERRKFDGFAKAHIGDKKFMESFTRYTLGDFPLGAKIQKQLKAYNMVLEIL